MAHAKRSASKFPRLALCPGSLNAEEGLPDSTSVFAWEGSCAHHLAALCLKRGVNTSEYEDVNLELPDDDKSDEFGNSFTPSDDMLYYVQEYLDYCRNLGIHVSEFKVETLVDYTQWVPGDGYGTADFIGPQWVENQEAVLHVVDLKFGKGVQVYAKDNEQALCYAMGASDEYPTTQFKEVHLHIHQPRMDHVDVCVYTYSEFIEQMARIEAIALATDDPNAPRTPGEKQCVFCKANGTKRCPEVAKYVVKVGLEGFDIIDTVQDEAPAPKVLSPDQIGNILNHRKMVERFLDNVSKHALEEAMEGTPIPGHKIVLSTHNRKWRDPEDMLLILKKQRKILKKQYIKESLVSFTVIEKIVGRGSPIVDDNVYKPEGKPILVPNSDKRDVYVDDATEGFERLETDDPLADLM